MKNYYLKIFKTLIFVVLVFVIPYICKVHVLKKFFLNTIHERGSAKLARSFKHGASNFIFHGKVKFFLSVHTDLANRLNLLMPRALLEQIQNGASQLRCQVSMQPRLYRTNI